MTVGHKVRKRLLKALRRLPAGVEEKLKKHKRMLPFIGVALGLLTVGVNEGYRLRWEHTADAIDLATYVYGIRGDTIHTYLAVEDLADNLQETLHVPKGRGLAAKAGIMNRTVLESYLESLKGSLADTELLIEKLSDEPEFKKRAEELKKEVQQKDHEAFATTLKVGSVQSDDSEPTGKDKWLATPKDEPVYSGPVPPNLNAVIEPDPSQKEQTALELQMFTLSMRLRDFNEDVLAKAKALKTQNEESARHAKYLVVCLILLSAGVGVLGKIFDEVPVDSAAGSGGA